MFILLHVYILMEVLKKRLKKIYNVQRGHHQISFLEGGQWKYLGFFPYWRYTSPPPYWYIITIHFLQSSDICPVYDIYNAIKLLYGRLVPLVHKDVIMSSHWEHYVVTMLSMSIDCDNIVCLLGLPLVWW